MFVICFALFHCLPICTHVCEFTLVCVWAFESLRSEMLALCNEYARRNFNSWRAKSIQNTYAPATQANSCFSPRWSLASYHQTDGTKFHLTWIVVHGRSTARDSRSCCEFIFFLHYSKPATFTNFNHFLHWHERIGSAVDFHMHTGTASL